MVIGIISRLDLKLKLIKHHMAEEGHMSWQ